MSNLIGQHLGQYEITELLGEGGMATVYRARQTTIKRDVAIKVIKHNLIGDSEFLKRFEREAQTVASLSHIHILKVFDYGQQEDLVYLVMELLTGGSLASLIRQGSLSPELTSRLLDQIASALDYAHEKGVIHRDLKPQNVLLDEKGNTHLTDFGIVKLMTELTDMTALTQGGAAMGTPAYMAPEQWRGQPVDARVDIYALGVMLFEMLAGVVPFVADTPASMMYAHLNEPPPPVLDLRPDLPAGIQQVINKALAKDREQRYQSADQMAAALKTIMAHHVPTAAPPARSMSATPLGEELPTAVQNRPPRKRSVLPLVGLVTAGLVLIGALALGLVLSRSPAEPSTTPTVPGATQAAFQPTPLTPTRPQVLSATPTMETVFPTSTSGLALVVPTSPPSTYTDTVPAATLPPTHTSTLTPAVTRTATQTPTVPTPTFTVTKAPTHTQTIVPTSPPPTYTHTVPPATIPPTRTSALTRTATPTMTLTATRTPTVPTATFTMTNTPTMTATPHPMTFSRKVVMREEPRFAVFDGLNRLLTLVKLNPPGNITSPELSWSPDGARLVFSAHPTSKVNAADSQLFVVNADGTNLTQLTHDRNNNLFGAWSPNGELIAFHSSCDLQLVRPDGARFRRILSHTPSGPSCVSVPRWSPDGEWLAFVGTDVERFVQTEIWVVRQDGLNLRRIYSGPKSGLPWDAAFVWSPDGHRLIYRLGTTSLQIDTQCFKGKFTCNTDSVSKYTGAIPESWFPNFYPQWAGEDIPRFTFLATELNRPVDMRAEPGQAAPIVGTVLRGKRVYVRGESDNGYIHIMTSFGQIGWVKADALGFQRLDFDGTIQVRGGPGPKYEIVGTLSSAAGQQPIYWATGLDSTGRWLQILYQRHEGWIEYPKNGGVADRDALPVRTDLK